MTSSGQTTTATAGQSGSATATQ